MKSSKTGERMMLLVTSAARKETSVPITPAGGPPMICPKASIWPRMEMMVARTFGSLFWVSQVW